MKEKIMTKLFGGEELTNEEIIFIGKNLNDSEQKTIPYDHEQSNTLTACGVKEEDFEKFNNFLKATIEDKREEIKGMSSYIQKFEEAALVSPRNLRMLMMNYVKMCAQTQHPLLGLLGLFGGRR